MGNFWRVFLRVAITIVLAVFAALGFGADWWVRSVMGWRGTNPAEPTVTLLRIAGAAVGVACICAIAIALIWAVFHPRRFSASFNFQRDVEAAVIQFNIRTGQQLPNRTTFARIHVESVRRNVTACTAAIAALEKLKLAENLRGGNTAQITGIAIAPIQATPTAAPAILRSVTVGSARLVPHQLITPRTHQSTPKPSAASTAKTIVIITRRNTLQKLPIAAIHSFKQIHFWTR